MISKNIFSQMKATGKSCSVTFSTPTLSLSPPMSAPCHKRSPTLSSVTARQSGSPWTWTGWTVMLQSSLMSALSTLRIWTSSLETLFNQEWGLSSPTLSSINSLGVPQIEALLSRCSSGSLILQTRTKPQWYSQI